MTKMQNKSNSQSEIPNISPYPDLSDEANKRLKASISHNLTQEESDLLLIKNSVLNIFKNKSTFLKPLKTGNIFNNLPKIFDNNENERQEYDPSFYPPELRDILIKQHKDNKNDNNTQEKDEEEEEMNNGDQVVLSEDDEEAEIIVDDEDEELDGDYKIDHGDSDIDVLSTASQDEPIL